MYIKKCVIFLFAMICFTFSYPIIANEFEITRVYSPAKLELGRVYPKVDLNGSKVHFAERYTYDTKSLLVSKEFGYLSIRPEKSVLPKAWEDFNPTITHSYVYDSNGRLAVERTHDYSVSLYPLTVTQYAYDNRNRVTCKAVRMNRSSFYSLPSSACNLGSSGSYGRDRIEKYEYNIYNDLIKVVKAYNTNLEQSYKFISYIKPGVIDYTKDSKGNLTKYVYDGFGRLKRTYYPSKTSVGQYDSSDYEEFSYDENDNIIKKRLRNGSVITYSFDEQGKLYLKNLPGTQYDVYYGYDLFGNMKYARFSSSTGYGITRGFDGFSRLVIDANNTDGVSRTIYHTYDKNDNRLKVTHPDGKFFNYEYDALNRLVRVVENGNAILQSYEYNAFNNVSTYRRPSGDTSVINYDSAGRLISINHNLAGTSYDVKFAYDYNPSSQIVTRTISNDKYIDDRPVGGDVNYTSNGLNQYVNVDQKTLAYDTNGSLINDGYSTFNYDAENRLTYSSRGNSSLGYDPLGRLNYLISNGLKTTFIFDGNALINEYKNGVVDKRYVNSNNVDDPIVMYSGSNVGSSYRQFFIKDILGSIIAGVNNSGYKTFINKYDSYGVAINPSLIRYGYTGQIALHELELNYYKARIYHPKLGRFLQTDPVGYEDQMNLYAYVGNDPINNIDPTGKNTQMLGTYLGARLDGKSHDEAVKLMKLSLKGQVKAAETVISLTPAGTIKDGIEIAVDVSKGKDPTAQVASMGVSEVASAAVEKVIEKKVGKDTVEVVKALTGKITGDITKPIIEEKINATTQDTATCPKGHSKCQ